MIIFINNKSTKFCQITLRIKRFIGKRKGVPFFLPHSVYRTTCYLQRFARHAQPPRSTKAYIAVRNDETFMAAMRSFVKLLWTLVCLGSG